MPPSSTPAVCTLVTDGSAPAAPETVTSWAGAASCTVTAGGGGGGGGAAVFISSRWNRSSSFSLPKGRSVALVSCARARGPVGGGAGGAQPANVDRPPAATRSRKRRVIQIRQPGVSGGAAGKRMVHSIPHGARAGQIHSRLL